MPVSKHRRKPSKGNPKTQPKVRGVPPAIAKRPFVKSTPDNIILVNRGYLEEARMILIHAISKVSPYNLNADGEKFLNAFHESAFLPYCRPLFEIDEHPNGCRVKSVMIRRSDKPFPDLIAQGLDENEQREGSRRLYCIEESALDLCLARFTWHEIDVAPGTPDPNETTPDVLVKVEDDGSVRVTDAHEEAVDLNAKPLDEIIDAEYSEVMGGQTYGIDMATDLPAKQLSAPGKAS